MKLCYDNLERIYLDSKGDFRCRFSSDKSLKYLYNEECEVCKEPFLYRVDSGGRFCSLECTYRSDSWSAGRPKGHRLGENTKKKISNSMVGKVKEEGVKDKISETLLDFWARRKFSVSDEMLQEYKDHPDAIEWILAHANEIDGFDGVVPERRIRNESIFVEIPTEWIEQISIDDLDPEKLILLLTN